MSDDIVPSDHALLTPANACDTHIHFYHHRFPTAAAALLHPPDATVDPRRCRALGLARYGRRADRPVVGPWATRVSRRRTAGCRLDGVGSRIGCYGPRTGRTRASTPTTTDELAALRDRWIPHQHRQRVLVDKPARLYGFD